WAGHSKGTIKRFDELVVPACITAGVPLLAAVRELNMIPPAEMPAYYQRIDLMLCASTSEGTNGPLLEAAASGAVPLSTRVGSADLLIEHGVTGFFLEPTIDAIASQLFWCREHPAEVRAM